MSGTFKTISKIPDVSGDDAYEVARKIDTIDEMADKSELKEIRGEIKSSRGDMKNMQENMEANMAKQEMRLTQKIADAKHSTIKWVAGIAVFLFVGLSSVIVGTSDMQQSEKEAQTVESIQSETAADTGSEPSETAADLGSTPSGTEAADLGSAPSETAAADMRSEPSETAADLGSEPSETETANLGSEPSETQTAHLVNGKDS